MSEDLSARLRSAFRLVDASVAVITAGVGPSRIAMTATAFTTVSLDPPTILVCVNRSSRIHSVITATGGYRLNVLANAQVAVAQACRGGDIAARFDHGDWRDDAPRGPRLTEALASIGCALSDAIERGSHSIFIGAVEDVATHDVRPLLYANGDYVCARA